MLQASKQTIWTAVVSIALLVFLETTGVNALFLVVAVGIATIAALIAGTRLPHEVRIVSTVLIAYFGYCMCLVGRTTQPGLRIETMVPALTYFASFAALPTISITRMWRRPTGVLFAAAVLPVSLLLALGVAGLEEHLFVRKHQVSGVGPTPRWTVSMHWLSYDAKTGTLAGSD